MNVYGHIVFAQMMISTALSKLEECRKEMDKVREKQF